MRAASINLAEYSAEETAIGYMAYSKDPTLSYEWIR